MPLVPKKNPTKKNIGLILNVAATTGQLRFSSIKPFFVFFSTDVVQILTAPTQLQSEFSFTNFNLLTSKNFREIFTAKKYRELLLPLLC